MKTEIAIYRVLTLYDQKLFHMRWSVFQYSHIHTGDFIGTGFSKDKEKNLIPNRLYRSSRKKE